MSRYRFHRCQPHAKCPNLTGWYLEWHPDDVETVMKVHKGVVSLYFFKFGQDPHVQKERCSFYDPATLGAWWLQSVEHYLLRGETLLVNSNGGIMPMDGTIILETAESDDLHWDDRFNDEQITISRWPVGRHWYLSSTKGRVFCPAKYDSLAEVRREAERYVPADRIRMKECAGALPPE